MRQFASNRGGLKISYEVRGRGAPLALIMGFGGSGRGWGEPLLSILERKFTTIVIDNRGTGESDKPDSSWTLRDMAADAACVLDHAGIERAHVFGVSMGGMIAQEMALGFSRRVRGLVLGCTACGTKHMIPAAPEAYSNIMPTPGLDPEEFARRALSVACSKAFMDSERGRAFIDELLAEMRAYPPTPMHTFRRHGEAVGTFDSFDRLKTIKAPTLVITGDADALIPNQNSEIIRREIPGARLHLIKGAGHSFFWEAPDEVAQTVGDFLSEVN